MIDFEPVLYDFDKTIVRHDSFDRFALWFLRKHTGRRLRAAASAALLAPGILTPATRDRCMSVVLWAGTSGLTERDLHAAIADFVAGHVAVADWLVESAARSIEASVARGQRVIVVTGCEEILARALCSKLGLSGISDLIGSKLTRRLGGWVVSSHCRGERKVQRLAAAGYPAPWSHVYTDSASDLPLLRRARRATLVNPSPATRARVFAELGERVEVASWK